MSDFGHEVICGRGLHIDIWGDGPFTITAAGKTYRFEDSDRFGPALVRAITVLREKNERLKAWIAKPPKHDYWGAGEPDCPREIKAGNGELHTLRCKACGLDSPRYQICRAILKGEA